jgi:hypothetical protein
MKLLDQVHYFHGVLQTVDYKSLSGFGYIFNSHLTVVETFIKKLLKEIFSLPTNTPDPVPYILSGLIPIEGHIHPVF